MGIVRLSTMRRQLREHELNKRHQNALAPSQPRPEDRERPVRLQGEFGENTAIADIDRAVGRFPGGCAPVPEAAPGPVPVVM